ncbi:MAG: thiamine phosphate synthase [Oceanipulchritudo sp.]
MSQQPVRTGFYGILDTGYVDDNEWEYKAEGLLAGGACLLQIRAKGHPLDRICELTERILPAVAKHAVPLIINDHLQVALEFPGTGLHLGQEDGDIRAAREKLGPGRVLGLSTHSLEQARMAIEAADILSYFAVGPVFPTGTKPAYTPVGTDLVRRVADLAPPLPFFCIGGINRLNVDEVIAAGARGIVAVSDPLQDSDTESATRFYVERLATPGDA